MAKIIALSGDVGWEITASKIRTELAAANGKDVEFHVNSPGGFVFDAFEIFNLIRGYKGKTEARITGFAASAASYIILAADKVTAHENAVFMIHNAWNLAIGDHNDMRKVADTLESLSNILAKAYAKKTGKSLDNIKGFMDADSFFFGDEILAEGFVDEIIEVEDDSDDDKASAITKARASMDTCLARMRTSDAANADFDRAVAYVDGMSALMDKPTVPAVVMGSATGANATITTPAGAGKTQEDKSMTFTEFLAANPTAQADYDAALATARTEGEKAAKDEMKAVIASISPKLTSEAYGPDVKEAGIKAITGEGHISTFETLVVIADRDIEAAKAEAAKAETKETKETKGNGSGDPTEAEATAALKKKKDDVLAQGGF